MKAFMSQTYFERCEAWPSRAEQEAREILAESEPLAAKVAFLGPYDAFIVETARDDQETHYYADVTCYAALAEALSSFLEG